MQQIIIKNTPEFTLARLLIAITLGLIGLLGTAPAARAADPVPLISQLTPPSAAPGGAGFTLMVGGSGFSPDSVAEWDGSELFTIINSSDELMATVPASLVATAGTARVTVVSPGAPASNVVFFPIAASQATVGFGLTQLTGFSNVGGVLTGDFNNDGIPDLAVETGFSLEILLGNGDGTFRAPISNPISCDALLAIGDFNGDGKLDVLDFFFEGSDFGTISVYLGNGDGTFTAGASYGTDPALSIFTGDFNGDGKLDFGAVICHTHESTESVSVYLGNGDGTFQSPLNLTSDTNGGDVAVGDFNGDGRLDLAAPATGNNVEILLGNGDGSFQSPVAYPALGGSAAATADFNGDGKADLTIAGSGAGVSVLLGNGDGTFQAPVSYATNPGSTVLTIADLNGDGKLDLAVLDSTFVSAFVSVLAGNGDGTFQNHIDFPAGTGPINLALADFNGDGRLDLATSYNINTIGLGTISLLLQGGVSLAPTTLTFPTEIVGSTSLRRH